MKKIIFVALAILLANWAFSQVPPFTIKGDTLKIEFEKFIYTGQISYSTQCTTSFPSKDRKEPDVISYTVYSMCDETAIMIKRVKGVATKLRFYSQNNKHKL